MSNNTEALNRESAGLEVQMKPLSEALERRNFEAWFLTFRPDWSPDGFTMTNTLVVNVTRADIYGLSGRAGKPAQHKEQAMNKGSEGPSSKESWNSSSTIKRTIEVRTC